MIARTMLTLSFLVPLAACGGTAPADNQAAAAAPSVDYAARIAALTDTQRNGVFLRAIRDAGQECQGVTTSAAAPPTGDKPAWTATCTDGKPWLLMLEAGGVMTVVDPVTVRGAG